jgi:hypothetical protein
MKPAGSVDVFDNENKQNVQIGENDLYILLEQVPLISIRIRDIQCLTRTEDDRKKIDSKLPSDAVFYDFGE